jgi:regulator of replication initiation timing
MKRIIGLTLLINFIVAPAAFAAVTDEDIAQLREQLAAMSQRLEELAAENAELRREVTTVETSVAEVQATTLPAAKESWTDRLVFKGDTRLRYENIDEDGSEGRGRQRFRSRLGVTGQVNDDIKIVLQLATGGDNPVSTNQSFDGGFSRKDIGVDLAYFDWAAADGLHVFGGKMKNPLYRAGSVPLIYDGDLNPEGLAVKYSKGMFFGNAGIFSVEERSSSGDSRLTALQAGANFSVGDNAKLTVGAGYFAYSDTVGNSPFYNGSAKGNSVDINGDYIYDYKNTEFFSQFDTSIGDWPLSIYGHWTKNNEVSEQHTASAFGAKIGSASNNGDMEFSWTYQDIEADAVIGTFSDSDFGGGGTDSSGHILKAKYALSKGVSLAGTYFMNDVDRFQGTEHDYDRLQLDVEFKFQ